MIKLLPVTEPTTIDMLNKIYKQNAKYAYVCIDKKEIIASALYDINGNSATILNVSTLDKDIFDGLVRAIFASLIDLKINKAEFSENVNREIIEQLNFVNDDTFFVNSLEEIINNCKKCKKV